MNHITRAPRECFASTGNSTGIVGNVIDLIRVYPPEPIKSQQETPNDVTIQAMTDVRAGKNLVRCKSADDMFRKLGI